MPAVAPKPDRSAALDQLCREHELLAVYLFGSRADEGLGLLEGAAVPREGSDLDIGVVFAGAEGDPAQLADLQVALEDLFAPLRMDPVPLQSVGALFQFDGIDGHRVATTDSWSADEYELLVMRRGAELLPIERQLQREFFGASAREPSPEMP